MAKIFKAILTAVIISILRVKSADAGVCLNEDPCLCQLDEYKKIDLTQISKIFQKDQFLEDDFGNYRFYFHGCTDASFDANAHKLVNASVNVTSGSLIEAFVNTSIYNNTVTTATNISSWVRNTIKFAAVEGKKDSYKIVYNTDKGVVADVNLVCVKSDHSNLKFDDDSVKTPRLFTLYSPYACIQTDQPGLSGGSVLCIIFFLSLGVYFIGGALLLYFVRGARGLELIPNIDFWRSLPGLVKDGIIFLFSGCNTTAIATPETYDRI